MPELFQQLLLLCPLLLLAGIVDGISGGGGLIALPSYLLVGLPISTAYGCNKMQSCLGTCASLYKYARSGFLDIRTALPAAIAAIGGSYLSTRIMLGLSDSVKNIIITCAMLFVICLTLVSGRIQAKNADRMQVRPDIPLSHRSLLLYAAGSLGIGLLLGLYDGFFGPGGGTVAILLFSCIFKYDLRTGGGNGKFIIVLSNLTAMFAYIQSGHILYAIAIPCSIANIAGSYLGASLATSRGAGFVRKVSLVVVAALAVYTVSKLL